MAFQTVKWTSNKKLPCAGCSTADVKLRVRSELIAQPVCPTGSSTANTDFLWKTINAQLIGWTPLSNVCSGALYQYTFSYDATQLLAGTTLSASDISGVICSGTLTDYIDQQAGNDVYIEDVDGGPFLVTQHGCRYNLFFNPGAFGFSITDVIDFSAQPDGHIETVDLVVTNMSATLDGEIEISIVWSLQVDGSNAYQCGLVGSLLRDGNPTGVANVRSHVRATNSEFYYVAGDRTVIDLLQPGQTATYTLQLELDLTVEPDAALAARQVEINITPVGV